MPRPAGAVPGAAADRLVHARACAAGAAPAFRDTPPAAAGCSICIWPIPSPLIGRAARHSLLGAATPLAERKPERPPRMRAAPYSQGGRGGRGRRQAVLAVTAYGAFLQPAPGRRRRLRGHAAGVSPSGGRRGRAGEHGRLAARSFGGKPRQQSSLSPALRPVRPGWPPASQGPGRARAGLPVGARGDSAGPVEGGGERTRRGASSNRGSVFSE